MSTTNPNMGNPRAEELFVNSTIPDTPINRRAIRQDASYMMNCVPGMRFSDCVESSIRAFPNLASPLALSILKGEGHA